MSYPRLLLLHAKSEHERCRGHQRLADAAEVQEHERDLEDVARQSERRHVRLVHLKRANCFRMVRQLKGTRPASNLPEQSAARSGTRSERRGRSR